MADLDFERGGATVLFFQTTIADNLMKVRNKSLTFLSFLPLSIQPKNKFNSGQWPRELLKLALSPGWWFHPSHWYIIDISKVQRVTMLRFRKNVLNLLFLIYISLSDVLGQEHSFLNYEDFKHSKLLTKTLSLLPSTLLELNSIIFKELFESQCNHIINTKKVELNM